MQQPKARLLALGTLAAVLMVGLMFAAATPHVLASDVNVVWTKADGMDFAGDDIWFSEMYGATNGFPLENQIVGDDPVGKSFDLAEGQYRWACHGQSAQRYTQCRVVSS